MYVNILHIKNIHSIMTFLYQLCTYTCMIILHTFTNKNNLHKFSHYTHMNTLHT